MEQKPLQIKQCQARQTLLAVSAMQVLPIQALQSMAQRYHWAVPRL